MSVKIRKYYDYLDEKQEDEDNNIEEEDIEEQDESYLNELFGGKDKFEKTMAEATPMTREEYEHSCLVDVMSYEEYLEREKKL